MGVWVGGRVSWGEGVCGWEGGWGGMRGCAGGVGGGGRRGWCEGMYSRVVRL